MQETGVTACPAVGLGLTTRVRVSLEVGVLSHRGNPPHGDWRWLTPIGHVGQRNYVRCHDKLTQAAARHAACVCGLLGRGHDVMRATRLSTLPPQITERGSLLCWNGGFHYQYENRL